MSIVVLILSVSVDVGEGDLWFLSLSLPGLAQNSNGFKQLDY